MFRFFFQGAFGDMHHQPMRRRHHARQNMYQEYHAAPDAKNNLTSLLFAFLPFLLIIAINIMSGAPTQYYSLTKTQSFPNEMKTYRLHATFFVNDAFQKLNMNEKAKLMVEIDNEYYQRLYNECVKEFHRANRYGRSNPPPQEGSWCYKFNEAKRVMQPGY